MKLIIGNRNYSSWSLRPWILMRAKDINFEEVRIPLYQPGSEEALAQVSASGLVPVLHDEDLQICDSLAICEYVAELFPTRNCWPADRSLRAQARSVSAEMHSGFNALRDQMPMNCRKRIQVDEYDEELSEDIRRIRAIWSHCLEQNLSQDGFLFGDFSIVDAMFAPVVIRFENCSVKVGETERVYMQRILNMAAMKEWFALASEEPEIIKMAEI